MKTQKTQIPTTMMTQVHLKWSSLAFLWLLFGLAPQGSGAPQLSKRDVTKVTLLGQGCDERTTHLDVIDGNLQLRFDSFLAVAQQPGQEQSSECDIEMTVQPPKGTQLAIIGATLEGAVLKAGDGHAQATHSYSLLGSEGQENGMEESWNTSFSETENELVPFTCTMKSPFDRLDIPAGWKGECGKPTVLKGKISLQADGNSNGRAEIYVDRNIARTKSRLQWDWELIPCDDDGSGNDPENPGVEAMAGQWKFSYRAQNGRVVTGKMVVTGNAGSYRVAGAPWSGSLFDLRPSGGHVRGVWRAQGTSGWVEFRPAQDGQSFQGNWGFDQASEPMGFWNGQRSD